MVVREGLLGAKRLAPPGSPPARPAALNLDYAQVVEPDFWSVEGSSCDRTAMDADEGIRHPMQLVVREGLEHFYGALDIDEFIVSALEELSPK